MKLNSITLCLLISFFLTTSFVNWKHFSPNQHTSTLPCSIGIFEKNYYHGTISILDWSDDDYGYLYYNLTWGDYQSNYFDNSSPINISITLPQSHPTGSFSVIDADNATVIYCTNITSGQNYYSFTISSPVCGKNYIVQISDSSC